MTHIHALTLTLLLLVFAPIAYADDTHERPKVEARPDHQLEDGRPDPGSDARRADEAQPGTDESNQVGKPGTRTGNEDAAGDAPLN